MDIDIEEKNRKMQLYLILAFKTQILWNAPEAKVCAI